jgi:signal peptidase I
MNISIIAYFKSYFAERRRKKFYSELKGRRVADDDILDDETKVKFDNLLAELNIKGTGDAAIKKATSSFKALKLKPYTKMRNILDLLVVVGSVAFGIRGLFFQPFQIPTSSMQPTLYGIHYRNNVSNDDSLLKKIYHAITLGGRTAKAKVPQSGQIATETIEYTPGFFDKTTFYIGNNLISLPGDPAKIVDYAAIQPEKAYQKGDLLCDGLMVLGDHLFVERFSLYLKEPARGDVMVFNTANLVDNDGTPLINSSGYYYIKRCVGLPGDTLKLENNQLYVKPSNSQEFVPIQKLDKRFKRIYSKLGGYHGHLSNMGDEKYTNGNEFTLKKDEYFMLGDNSKFSKDSRFFGPVPRVNLVGRAFLVFWPFSRRWGLVDTKAAYPEPTGKPGMATFPVMWKQ